MNSFLFPTFLADIPPNVLIIAIAGMAIAIVIVVAGIYFQSRRTEAWHQTARLALEKGQPIPAFDEGAPQASRDPREEARNDIRSGLISIGVGIGLALFLNALVGRGLAYVGAIPGFIGIALLVNAALNPRNSDGKPPTSS